METKENIKQLGAFNNGFLHLFLNIVLIVFYILGIVWLVDGKGLTEEGNPTLGMILFIILGALVYILHFVGFCLVQPNQSRVFTFFGRYVGTLRKNGFFWVNPLYGSRRISLRARNMDVEPIKVNDRNGNPIMIGLVLVWKVRDTYKACFDVETDVAQTKEGDSGSKTLNNYDNFVKVQSNAALRKVAGLYAYDNMDETEKGVTLRAGGEEVNNRLEEELRNRLAIAGIEVVEARINYLAYASEIASVMLRRQQADAIISAREKIVEGAVSMVDLALKKLSNEHIVELDEERKAAMVSNLLVVLCADESASPVINTGTLYQ